MQAKVGAAVGLLIVAPVLGVTLFGLAIAGGADADAALCNPELNPAVGISVDPKTVPEIEVAGYGHAQLVNAAYIVQAGQALDLGVRDQTIGVMTAMGESSLKVIDYGDDAGPDSRGLFQQRANGAWGTYADRMDPYISSTNFFRSLQRLPNRESLTPTIVAHRVQANADPHHYTPYWDKAVAVVQALAGVDIGLNPEAGDQVCSSADGLTPEGVNKEGWSRPAKGPITSPYGNRFHPIYKEWRFHSGTDLGGGGCDGPVWAVQNGVVTFADFDGLGNGTITIDHGQGIQSSYLHEPESGILVRVGDQVKAGDQIGRIGDSGQAKGCHLHFVIKLDGAPTDPVPFMAQYANITLGE